MSYFSEVMADTPVAYWRFGEPSGTNAADSSGNALNGVYVNTPTLGVAGAISDGNTAVQFAQAANENVTVSHDALFDFGGTCTLEVWVKRGGLFATHSFQALCGKGNNSPQLQFRNDDRIYCTKAGVALINHGPVVTDFDWHHLVGVFLPASVGKLYWDGVDVTIGDSAQTTADTASGWRLAAQGSGDQVLEGSLDEYAMYNYELPAARVLAHYNAASQADQIFLPQTSSIQIIRRKAAIGA